MPMVDKPNLKEDLDFLGVRTREEILRVLYDGKEKSAYKIATEVDMATATIIEHLTKLEAAGMIKSKDATKGKLIRRYYNITKKGKETLVAFLRKYADELKKNKEIADTFANLLGRA